MRVALLTREYPPEVYGGAGVHVEHLARELAALAEVEVHCFGGARDDGLVARAYEPWAALAGSAPELAALRTMSVDLAMASSLGAADLVHSHTWYANLAGHLAKLLYGVPHVLTAHSLEPLRPWKAEQLGGGYAVSSWCERVSYEAADAVIAVSAAMRDDVLATYPAVRPEIVHVIHNGIDVDVYRPGQPREILTRVGLDAARPYAMFLGRLTRQKGLHHLLDAAPTFDRGTQLLICASAPDTVEVAEDVRRRVGAARRAGIDVVWIEEALPRADAIALLEHAAVFVCPSVYEPFGLINVEAMACETAVVATAVGGIPEIVVDGETGVLVPLTTDDEVLAARLAAAVNDLVADPDRAAAMGAAGRQRAVEHFSWKGVARDTAALYRSLLDPH